MKVYLATYDLGNHIETVIGIFKNVDDAKEACSKNEKAILPLKWMDFSTAHGAKQGYCETYVVEEYDI